MEAAAALRIYKCDLSIWPGLSSEKGLILAHIFVSFLAYVLWKTLNQFCGKRTLPSEPRRAQLEFSAIRSMNAAFQTRSGLEIPTGYFLRSTNKTLPGERHGDLVPRG